MISVIVPCYNEQEVLPLLYTRLTAATKQWGDPCEIVAVDDGSNDNTWLLLQEIHERDPRWKLISFSRNFGHQTAVSAGIHYAQGDCVVIIDADLQDPPEVIKQFIDKWNEGYDVVYAIRKRRKENILKRLSYKTFYMLLAKIADVKIPLDSGDFCVMDRKVVDLIKLMPEQNRFVRGLRAWTGFRQIGIEYERHTRVAGTSRYTFKKLLKLAVDGVLSFSKVPLRLITHFGAITAVISFIAGLFCFIHQAFSSWLPDIGLAPVPGYAVIVIAIFFLGGVQLICLGAIGEYVGRIYDEVKRRPLWIIRQTVGIEER